MKKLILLLWLIISSTSIFATEVRLTNGVSFDIPEGYQYFKHKRYSYSAQRDNDILYLGAMYGEEFNKELFYTSADTILFNLSGMKLNDEKHSKLWTIGEKFIKRYYTSASGSHIVTYTCHTESKAGFVIAATYSTDDQLAELEEMFDSIKLAHKNVFHYFGFTVVNGGWLLFVFVAILLFIRQFVSDNSLGNIILPVVGVGTFGIVSWLSSIMLEIYLVPMIIWAVLMEAAWEWLCKKLSIGYKHTIDTSDSSDNDGGDSGDDSTNNDHTYISSSDGNYYTPIDL